MLLPLLYLSLLTRWSANAFIDGTKNECAPEKDICEFWLTVREKLTMIYNKDLVYAENGKLYKYDECPNNYTSEIPIEDVVTVDGYNRMVIAVNETIPGPPIVVYEGQHLRIHVRNLLLSDSVTIHWHGLGQEGTPFMDGVGYITQCPISAGQTFTYQFKAKPHGTFWYHSHVGAQRTNGVFGALIIKQRPKVDVKVPIDMIMTVGDWHHQSSEEVYTKMEYGNFIGKNKYKPTHTLDGGKFSGVPWVSGLIEGKGRYIDQDTGKLVKAPLTWYRVQRGETYRFRVIAIGVIFPLRISVDDHLITVVATDGFDTKPIEVESFIINPGERFDFLLEATNSIENYWIRAVSMEVGVANHSIEAILHYEGASLEEPITERAVCNREALCHVLNCPFYYYPVDQHIKCQLISDMENANKNDVVPLYEEDSEEHFLNFAFPGTSVTPGAVNGRKFEFPGVNSLTQSNEIGDYDCDKHDCGEDKVCYCHYELKVPFNKTIQMVWINMGRGAGWGHPIHLHGHSFYVMKMAYLDQNKTTGELLYPDGQWKRENFPPQVQDVDCGNSSLNFCNDAKWKNQSWNNGNVPGLNLKNPPRKDTLIIPTGGYAVIRIRSNNPGKWFMHCHIEVHALDGMAMVLSEAVDKAPKPPKGFPICKNFYNDRSRDFYSYETTMQEVCQNQHTPLYICGGILAAVIVIQFAINIYCFAKRRKKSDNTTHTVFQNENVM